MSIPLETAPSYRDFEGFYSDRPARRSLDTGPGGNLDTRAPNRYQPGPRNMGASCGGCMGASSASPARFARPGGTGYPGPSRPAGSTSRYPRGKRFKGQSIKMDTGTVLGLGLIAGLTLWAVYTDPTRR